MAISLLLFDFDGDSLETSFLQEKNKASRIKANNIALNTGLIEEWFFEDLLSITG
jgi:hypothetical protein